MGHAKAQSATFFVALGALLRAACIVRYRIDSDEPQHLHTAWLWSQGLVGYRDFYDNHTPLFHILMAPFIGAAGESPRILLIGRLLMLPIAAASLVAIYVIAKHLHGERVAAWTVAAAALVPSFLLKSIEFRNDNLWGLWCLLALVIVLRPVDDKRAVLLGVLAAVAVLTSLKSVFFFGALAIVNLLTIRLALFALLGFLPPLLLALTWFAAHDALRDFFWCAFEINAHLPLTAERRILGIILVLLALALAFRMKDVIARTTLLFVVFVAAFSPLISPRDLLPAFPMLAMFAVAALIRRPMLLRSAAVVLLVASIAEARLWQPPDRYPERLLAQTLELSRPSDLVLDLKGETIFRRRPSYIALEVVGRRALARGEVAESFVDDVVRKRCYLVTRDAPFFPPRTRAFLNAHFIPAGELRVAGEHVANDGTFSIAVPGPYVALDAGGHPLGAPGFYASGVHRVVPDARLVVWAPAARHFSRPTGYNIHLASK